MDSTSFPFPPASGPRHGTPQQPDLPPDLCLDLLVDGELPEDERRHFLLELDRHGASAADPRWRDLAIRFLQRQTEKQTAQALMAGGRLVPAEILPPRTAWSRLTGWRTITAAAASLLIVAIAGLALLELSPPHHPTGVASQSFSAALPPELSGDQASHNVVVPLVRDVNANAVQFGPTDAGDDAVRRSWVIYPNQDGNAVSVPVNTLKIKYN